MGKELSNMGMFSFLSKKGGQSKQKIPKLDAFKDEDAYWKGQDALSATGDNEPKWYDYLGSGGGSTGNTGVTEDPIKDPMSYQVNRPMDLTATPIMTQPKALQIDEEFLMEYLKQLAAGRI